MSPIEYHPFGNFLPTTVTHIVVGTFPGRLFTQMPKEKVFADATAWSYAGKNQFWKIISSIYDVPLENRLQKQQLFTALNIGMMDLIISCRRKDNNNLDENLIDITWNRAAFEAMIEANPNLYFLCTGKNVAAILHKWLPTHRDRIVALPSPSPRYAQMHLTAKADFYKQHFPKPQ